MEMNRRKRAGVGAWMSAVWLVIGFFVFVLVVPVVAHAQALDETWTVTVNGQTVQVNADGTFRIPNIAAPDQFGAGGPGSRPDFLSDDFVRVFGVSTAGGTTRYAFSEPFQFRAGQTFVIGDLIITDTPPPFPESISIGADSPLLPVGETTQLTVIGTLEDESTVDVTPRTTLTIYRTSNPATATVGQNGLVTGVSAGLAFITATNEGATSVKRITVTQAIRTTTIEGFARLEDGSALAGASITTTFGGSATSGADGGFSIPGFSTPSEAETILVRAFAQIDGDDYRGTSEMVSVIPDGVTDAGFVVLRLVVADFEEDFGTTLFHSDDSSIAVNLGFEFPFYGVDRSTVYVGSNGVLTFVNGDRDFTESVLDHLRPEPRISPLFDDFYPGIAGNDRRVKVNRLSSPDRLVVTWDRVPEYFNTGSNTFQVILFDDGRIQIGYRGVNARDGIVGLSPGGSVTPPFDTVDFSSLLSGHSVGAGRGILQQFNGSSSRFDLDGGFLVYAPGAGNAYDVSFIPPQNESSIGSGTLSGVATNADGSPCVGQVEVLFSCDQSFRRRCSLDSEGRYEMLNAPFGAGLRVTVVGTSIFGVAVVPVSATEATINISPINDPPK